MSKGRSGKFITQLSGYKTFIPNPLPPYPPIKYDDQLQFLLSEADRALARLDGVSSVLPNPDPFISMYTKKEALLSSQIEGTRASLEGLLAFEAGLKPKEDIHEIKKVINYEKALNYGIDRLKKNDFPMSLSLVKEIHYILLKGARGTSKKLVVFRRSQNWIGPPGMPINDAIFIPPPPNQVGELMLNLKIFMHRTDNIPPLVKIGLIHAQFETIHPFLDGNGRIGRLLITFYLYWKGILTRPLLYLSYYLKKYNTQNRDQDALRFEADTLKKLAYDRDTSLGLITRGRVEQITQVYRLLGFTTKPLNMDDLFYDQKTSGRIFLTPEEKSWISLAEEQITPIGG